MPGIMLEILCGQLQKRVRGFQWGSNMRKHVQHVRHVQFLPPLKITAQGLQISDIQGKWKIWFGHEFCMIEKLKKNSDPHLGVYMVKIVTKITVLLGLRFIFT